MGSILWPQVFWKLPYGSRTWYKLAMINAYELHMMALSSIALTVAHIRGKVYWFLLGSLLRHLRRSQLSLSLLSLNLLYESMSYSLPYSPYRDSDPICQTRQSRQLLIAFYFAAAGVSEQAKLGKGGPVRKASSRLWSVLCASNEGLRVFLMSGTSGQRTLPC